MSNPLPSSLSPIRRTSVLFGVRLHDLGAAGQSSAGYFAEVASARIAGHQGSLLQSSTSLVLAEFDDAAEAVNCAIDLQERFGSRTSLGAVEAPLTTSVGIHFGELYLSDGHPEGEGISLVKELADSAPASGILVTRDVYVRVRLLLPLKFESVGKKRFSASNDEKEVYSVGWESVTENLKASLKRLDQDDLQRATRLSSTLGINTSKRGSSIVLIFFALFLFVLLKVLRIL